MDHEIVPVCSAGKSAADCFTDHFCLQDIDKKGVFLVLKIALAFRKAATSQLLLQRENEFLTPRLLNRFFTLMFECVIPLQVEEERGVV